MSIDHNLNIKKVVLYYALATVGWIIIVDWLIWNGNQITWNMPALIEAMLTWKFRLWLLSEIFFVVTTSWGLYALLNNLVINTQERVAAEFYRASAEAKIINASVQFQAVLNSTKEVYVLLDRHANILAYNKRMEYLVRLLFKKDVQIGDSILWYGDPESEHDFLTNLERAFGGQRVMVERELMSGGKKIWVQMQFVPVRSAISDQREQGEQHEQGDVHSVAYISLDVTKLRQADAAIRASNRELETIRNAVYRSVRVSITDADGRITFANDSFVAAAQYSREELYGKTHNILRSNEHDNAYYTHLWRTIRAGMVWRGEICNRAKDGSLYWCDMVISPIFDEQGAIQQYMSIRSDITEKKRLEMITADLNNSLEQRVQERTAELQAAHDRLTLINAEKDDLMSIVAHDLRNPISSMMLMAEFIDYGLERGASSMLIQSKAKSIHELGMRTNAIINHLLESNRLESGNFSAHLTDVNLNEVAHAVIQDHRVHAEKKHIMIVHDFPEIPGIALADKILARQVLDNLISNAVKYSPAGTTVSVRIQHDDQYMLIVVSDEGPGIAPSELPRIFRKFARISNKPTAGESSIGLGLSAAKRMVELMHGSILCESVQGRGASFRVMLPRYDASVELPTNGAEIYDMHIHRTTDYAVRTNIL